MEDFLDACDELLQAWRDAESIGIHDAVEAWVREYERVASMLGRVAGRGLTQREIIHRQMRNHD